jgi:hypothetical protein
MFMMESFLIQNVFITALWFLDFCINQAFLGFHGRLNGNLSPISSKKDTFLRIGNGFQHRAQF